MINYEPKAHAIVTKSIHFCRNKEKEETLGTN